MRSVGILAALAFAMPGMAGAQTPVLVRSELDAPDHAWVGQRIRLDVLLLVPSQFTGVPAFDLPGVKDALLLRVGGGDARPTFGSERVDGVTYVSARYQFAAFFQRSGDFTIPPFEVRFASVEGFGKEPEWHTEATQEHGVSIESPAGTERLRVLLSTTKLDVEDGWDRSTDGARVGDAFTRTISMRAQDVPGLLLPVLPLERVEGLEAYPSDPSVDTATGRGAFVGTRVEHVTYICATEGTAVVPTLTLRWWNVATETLESVELDGVTFDIAAGAVVPETEDPVAPGSTRGWSRWWTAILAVTGVVIVLIVTQRARLAAWRDARRSRWRASERGRFAALRAELSGDDARSSLTALYRWLDVRGGRGEAATIEGLCRSVGDPELDRELEALVGAASGSTDSWSGVRLRTRLQGARSEEREAKREPCALPPLN